MLRPSDKIMFEIYREREFNRSYRVVFYTELTERNKEYEINRAMAGEHVFDGFIDEKRKDEAKEAITRLLAQLNNGAPLGAEEVVTELGPYLAG